MKQSIDKGIPKQRTISQNNALHLYLSQVAKELEREGHSMQDVIKHINKVEITPTLYNVKELIWREIQKVVLGKESTTELKKQEDIDKVYDIMNKWLGQYFGIHIPFPNNDLKQWEKLSHHEDTRADYPQENIELKNLKF